MFANLLKPMTVPAPADALPGRDHPILDPSPHAVLGTAIVPPFPEGFGEILFGMGCFWGAERLFWQLPGVWTTSVGYAGGHTPNATYREVCSGETGHTEVVHVVYDPEQLSLARLLATFWENHDPTQGMRQGNDIGTQYRSAIYASDPATLAAATASRDDYNEALRQGGRGSITTEIDMAGSYYLAEDDHQQYLHKNPHGYCGLRGTGISCSV